MRVLALCAVILAASAPSAHAFRKRSRGGAKAGASPEERDEAAPVVRRFALEHDLGDGRGFVKRADLEVQVLPDTLRATATLGDQHPVDAATDRAMKALAARGPASPYRLRLRPEGDGGRALVSSSRVCDLAAAGFKDEIVLSLTDASGAVDVFEHRPLLGHGAPACGEAQVPDAFQFDTSAFVSLPLDSRGLPVRLAPAQGAGASAVGQTPLETPVEGGADGEGGKKEKEEPPQSLLRQYWYLLVPLALMALMGGDEPQQQAQQGSAQGQGQGRGGQSTAQRPVGGAPGGSRRSKTAR